jgi:hypothetical protein
VAKGHFNFAAIFMLFFYSGVAKHDRRCMLHAILGFRKERIVAISDKKM